jgi:hypothetical protein
LLTTAEGVAVPSGGASPAFLAMLAANGMVEVWGAMGTAGRRTAVGT